MALPLWTILVATFGLVWFLRRRHSKNAKLKRLGLKELPGPKGWPFVGSGLDMGTNENQAYTNWAEKYGDLYKVKMFGQDMVIVSDPKLSKEIFSVPAFTGRMQVKIGAMYEDHYYLGLGNSEGERWEVHRRFLLTKLRDFGFGKTSMESLIMEDVEDLIKLFKKEEGTPQKNFKKTVILAVVNSLWSIVSSKRYALDDPELLNLATQATEALNDMISSGNSTAIFILPWLKYIIPEWSGYNNLRKVITETRSYFEDIVAWKKKSFKEGDQNDYIDEYMTAMKKAVGDPKSYFHGNIAEKNLVSILADLFEAGSDTTATTLTWTVLYLCKQPEVQKKLQQEIHEVTGDSNRVSLEDRPKMPYTLALIDEIFRSSTIVPNGFPHRAMADHEFHGYLIEKNTVIQPNIRKIHYDPKIWGDPQNFRPERFLSQDGKKYVKSENLHAFQPGRRVCLGEVVARDSVFLYITNLFQQFDMRFDPNEEEPSVEPVNGLLDNPQPFSVIMSDRLKK